MAERPDGEHIGGHRQLAEALFLDVYGELVGLAGLILGDWSQAEEVVQEVLAALCRRTEPLDDPAGGVGYVRRGVVNGARSRLRRRGVERRPHLAVSAATYSVEDEVLASDDARAVAEAVLLLPVRQRECIACRYQLGLSHTETATTLGISPGSVKTHLHRASKRLASLLEGQR